MREIQSELQRLFAAPDVSNERRIGFAVAFLVTASTSSPVDASRLLRDCLIPIGEMMREQIGDEALEEYMKGSCDCSILMMKNK